jgi:hypothetical protein
VYFASAAFAGIDERQLYGNPARLKYVSPDTNEVTKFAAIANLQFSLPENKHSYRKYGK